MSLLCMRMQPADTKPPTDPGLLVPWMASSLSASTSAAAPIGFFGEPDLDIEVRRALTAQRHRRLPRRLDVFAGDPRGAEPLLAGTADADRVLARLILAGDEIEAAFLALYHDGAGLGIAGVWDLFGGGARRRGYEDDRGGGENEKTKEAKQHGGARV